MRLYIHKCEKVIENYSLNMFCVNQNAHFCQQVSPKIVVQKMFVFLS